MERQAGVEVGTSAGAASPTVRVNNDLVATQVEAGPAPTTPGLNADARWDMDAVAPQFADFEILEKLGEGAVGVVFRARQRSADREVAIKILFPYMARNTRLVERFYREARTMGLLDHPNIIQAYAVGEENGYHYSAMECVDGQSLNRWLAELGKLCVGDALHITLECARALGYAHGRGLVHRDVKPENILVTRGGAVKLTDFGMVKVLDEGLSLTQTGHAVGTPCYMPLEQARNAKESDGRSDVYALGCTLYCMLTGSPPFAGATLVDLIQAKTLGGFPPARRANPAVPERLDLIIRKMVAREVKYRYQSCADVIRDLEALGLAHPRVGFLSRREEDAAPAPRRRPAPRDPANDWWYLRYKTRDGEVVTRKLPAAAILKLIEADDFDLTARASRERDGNYVSLATVRDFEPAMLKRVTKDAVDRRTVHNRAKFQTLADAGQRRWVQQVVREEMTQVVRGRYEPWVWTAGVGAAVVLAGLAARAFWSALAGVFW